MLELLEKGRDAPRAMELLDQVLARRADVREQRDPTRDLVEALEREGYGDPAGECQQVDDCVRPAADRHQHSDRVVECRGGEDLRGPQAFASKPDGAPPGRLRSAVAGRV